VFLRLDSLDLLEHLDPNLFNLDLLAGDVSFLFSPFLSSSSKRNDSGERIT